MTEPQLTPAQRRRLRRAAGRLETSTAAARARFGRIVAELVAEVGAPAVARELGVSRQAVHDRIKRTPAPAERAQPPHKAASSTNEAG